MAGFLSTLPHKLLFLLFVINNVSASKLNVPHVLLPIFSNVNVKFQLETVNGGCYKWSTTRIDVIQLTLVDPNPHLECSSKAIVSSISTERVRNVAVVLAEDVQTQLALRVDVIVDVIDKLSIVTTTKEVIMQEVPEVFRVVALDNQGNQFTSLQGVEFDWKIISLGANKDLTIFRFMTFKESPYETPPSIEEFEETNKMGDVVLLEGVKTGTAKLQVKLPYDEYAELEVCEIQMAVVANLIILPSDAYIMPYDVVQFKVYAINNGKMEELDLPNSQYFVDVESTDIASADPKTGEVTGLVEGRTKVNLRDRNVDDNDQSVKLPSAFINICTPAYITLALLPHKNWAVMVNSHHTIVAEVYSSGDHKLNIGPGVELETQIDEKFVIQERSPNGTWLYGWAKDVGSAPVRVVLEGVVNKNLGRSELEPISAKEEILIFPSITLKPTDVILPWDPVGKPRYEIPVVASGGDEKFLWVSTNHSIGVVTQTGVVKTHGDGEFEATAVMQRNHNNRESAKFYIVPPTKLEIIEHITEAEVGSNIFIHIALYGDKPESNGAKTQIPFTQCQDLPFKIKTSDPHFIENKEATMETIGISCANFAIVGSVVGCSKVTVSYNIEGKYLEDSVTITTFNPLKMLSPDRPIVLAVGTTIQLIFTGGPQPVQGKNSQYQRNITEGNDIIDAVDITQIMKLPLTEEDYTVIGILCKKLGETSVTLSVFSSTPRNTDCRITTKIICGKPRTVSLQPEIKVSDAESCPMDLSSDKVLVQSDQNIELDVIVRDENGLRFLNISSLMFEWNVDPPELATLKSRDGTISRDIIQGTLNFGNKSYQVVTPKSGSGTITVQTKIIGYHKTLLAKFKITPEWPEFLDDNEKGTELPPITTSISLVLVDDTIVTPNEVTIYNHPAIKKVINVSHGSGYYEMLLSCQDIADVIYSSNTRQIEITPRRNGDLRIDLVDLCLVSKPPSITVHVVSVSIIRVDMSDKLEINKCIACTVKLYDESDNLLAIPDIEMIALKVDQEPDIANFQKMTPTENEPWPDGHIKYVVHGDQLGETKVKFSILNSVMPVESALLDLQVFAPLRIHPRNLTMLVGTYVQYVQEGGPQPSQTVEYTLSNNKLGDISSNGLLNALDLGETKITGKCLGINPTTGQKVIYATDTVDVKVIPLQGFKIKAPLTRFKLTSEVPVWVTGVPEQMSPMVLGTAKPDYIYNWNVDDPDIMQLIGVFEAIRVSYDPPDQISLRVKGLRPGKTKLHLNVTIPGNVVKSKKKFVTYIDSLEFEVFEGLSLMSPAGFSGKTLLMAPYASLQLMTNRDSSSTISYKLVGDDQSTVTVTPYGMVKSQGQLGYVMILIISTDQHGLQQTLSLIVEVKPIHYMKLNVVADWTVSTSEFSNIIPLGTEFQLKATYHDNTGNEFSAGTAMLHLRTSRLDLARVKLGCDNSTLLVSINKPGITILKVWADGVQKTADYIKLHVGQAIVPKVTHLVTGDIVCMWTPVNAATPGVWTSSDEKLFAIDKSTGIGMVKATKGGKTYLKHSLHPVSPLQLEVVPISNLIFLPDGKLMLTNSIHGKVLEVPLVVAGESTAKKSNLLNTAHCKIDGVITIKEFPFDCELEFSNTTINFDIYSLFQVYSTFSSQTGMYGCTIGPTGLSNPDISVLDTKVILTARSKSNNVASDPLELDFLPGVFLDQELVLDENTYSADLLITGIPRVLAKIKVTPFDPNLLEISKPEKVKDETVKFKVKLVDYHWKLNEYEGPFLVKVYSQLTDENIRVNVKISSSTKFNGQEFIARGQSPLLSLLYSYRYVLIIMVSMLIIFLGTFYAYSQFIQPVIHVNVTPVRSLLAATPTTQGGVLQRRSFQSSPTSTRTTTQQPMNVTSLCSCNQSNCPQCPQSSVRHRSIDSTSTKDNIYGDPTNFYSTSPELRRNRRFM